ncbi:MAG: GNAT family protein [Thermomicrobiales bacterium]
MRESQTLDTPELETERLLLRRFNPADEDDIYRYCRDPEVARLTSWDPHRSIDDTRRFLDWALTRYEEGTGGPWAMVLHETGMVVGAFGLTVVWPHLRGEVGYWLGRPLWRQGLTTEAGQAILRYAFHDLELNRVEARCEAENAASERVMQKLGMSYEGLMRQQIFVKGVFRDMKLYAQLRSEWRGGSPR